MSGVVFLKNKSLQYSYLYSALFIDLQVFQKGTTFVKLKKIFHYLRNYLQFIFFRQNSKIFMAHFLEKKSSLFINIPFYTMTHVFFGSTFNIKCWITILKIFYKILTILVLECTFLSAKQMPQNASPVPSKSNFKINASSEAYPA